MTVSRFILNNSVKANLVIFYSVLLSSFTGIGYCGLSDSNFAHLLKDKSPSTLIMVEICNDGIDNDGDGLIDCFDCSDCRNSTFCLDSDNDRIGDLCDLDDDNDGVPDSSECHLGILGPELVPNGDFEDGYRHWKSDLNRGWNNATGIGAACVNKGWVAVSPCSSQNGICPLYYNYFGSARNGNTPVTTPIGTPPNIIQTTNCNSTVANCLAEILPDHTTGTGMSVYVDPDRTAGLAYWKSNVTVEARSEYDFSAWIMVIEEDPNLEFRIADSGILGSFNLDRLTPGVDGPDEWQQVSTRWYSGNISGTVEIALVNLTSGCIGNDIRIDDISLRKVELDCDCDSDGVPNHLDLDSDNDGIYDLYESGSGISDNNNDGRLDNARDVVGANGLANILETAVDNGNLNYSPANSEIIPDLDFDFCDLDSDGDGFLDTQEEYISDIDNNGIAGNGAVIVTTSGTIVNINYRKPINEAWQQPSVQPSFTEICNDGIDNDGDGLIDCADCADCDNGILPNFTAPADITIGCNSNLIQR